VELRRRPIGAGIIDRSTNRIVARSLRDRLQSTTPVRTGRLRRGWKIVKVTNSEIMIENDVYYGYWVDQGNTRGLKPRRFTKKAMDEFWRGLDPLLQKYYHRPEADYVEP
jgi:hypothetical protein